MLTADGVAVDPAKIEAEQVDFVGGACWAHPASTCCGCMFVSLDTVRLLRCFVGLTCNGCHSRTAVEDTHEDGDARPGI